MVGLLRVRATTDARHLGGDETLFLDVKGDYAHAFFVRSQKCHHFFFPDCLGCFYKCMSKYCQKLVVLSN